MLFLKQLNFIVTESTSWIISHRAAPSQVCPRSFATLTAFKTRFTSLARKSGPYMPPRIPERAPLACSPSIPVYRSLTALALA